MLNSMKARPVRVWGLRWKIVRGRVLITCSHQDCLYHIQLESAKEERSKNCTYFEVKWNFIFNLKSGFYWMLCTDWFYFAIAKLLELLPVITHLSSHVMIKHAEWMKMGNASVYKSQHTASCSPFVSSSSSPHAHDQCCFLFASLKWRCSLIPSFLPLSL